MLHARMTAGLSLRDLAARSGISAMAISKYERDQMKPGPAALEALARALDALICSLIRRLFPTPPLTVSRNRIVHTDRRLTI
jgi:transcriptional regulator with XRE-family HTH domain